MRFPIAAYIDFKTILRRGFRAIFWSGCCALCYGDVEGDDAVCSACMDDLSRSGYEVRWGNKMERRMLELDCSVLGGFAGYIFQRGLKIRQLVHGFKYEGQDLYALQLGRELGKMASVRHFDTDFDVLVPVPLHPLKQATRGYNQSELLARGMASVTGQMVRNDVLRRTEHRESQTKRSKVERMLAVENLYELAVEPQSLSGARIILIDDVFTTGSTIKACTDQLSKIPGVRLGVITLAATK